MIPVIRLRVARVVQFSHTHYDKDGIFLEFLVDVMRPVIVEDGVAIDIFSHQIYERVPMLDGVISIDTLGNLNREALYAYDTWDAEFPAEYLEEFLKRALETYRWYYEEHSKKISSPKRKTKIISIEEARKKLIDKKENNKLP